MGNVMGKCYGEILWGNFMGTYYGENLWGNVMGKFYGEMLWKNDVQQGLFHVLQNIPVSKESQNLKGTPSG